MSDTAADTAEDAAGAEAIHIAGLALDILEGKTDFAAIQGITSQSLEAVYTLGHGFFTTGDYASAASMFQFLTLHSHLESRYWFALGASQQMLGRHDLAVRSYGVSALLDVDNPQVPLRAGESFLALGDKENARNALEAALLVAGDDPRHAAYAGRAQLILGTLGTLGADGRTA